MELDIKYKIAIVVTSLTVAFAVGRYTVPEKVKIETKVVEVEKKSDKVHEKEKIVEETKPDGTKTVTTEITYDNDKTSDDESMKDDKKQIIKEDGKVTISGMAGFNFGSSRPIYGVSVTRPILGPLTLGVFGLNEPSAGISLGVTF